MTRSQWQRARRIIATKRSIPSPPDGSLAPLPTETRSPTDCRKLAASAIATNPCFSDRLGDRANKHTCNVGPKCTRGTALPKWTPGMYSIILSLYCPKACSNGKSGLKFLFLRSYWCYGVLRSHFGGKFKFSKEHLSSLQV